MLSQCEKAKKKIKFPSIFVFWLERTKKLNLSNLFPPSHSLIRFIRKWLYRNNSSWKTQIDFLDQSDYARWKCLQAIIHWHNF